MSKSRGEYTCNICNKTFNKANKAKHEKTKKHIQNKAPHEITKIDIQNIEQKEGGDLQSASSKLPNFPWAKYSGEHHLPKHNYTGPGTRLDIRLDENNNPKPGEEPFNRIDEAALQHDIAYKSEDIRDRHKADVDLIHDLNSIKNPTLRERVERFLVKAAMKAKILIGEGVDSEMLAKELHKEFRRPETYLKVKSYNKDDIWAIDLIETINPKNNDNYRYILTVIDLYTRYAWAVPLKNKGAISIKTAFEDLFEATPDRIPNKLWSDLGKEFYNKTFEEFLSRNNIEIYSSQNAPDERINYGSHNPVIERFNRTLKHWMYTKFTERGKRVWVDILPELMEKYNNQIHRSIGVTPKEASDNPRKILERTNENNTENDEDKDKQKFKVNDRVRIFKYKSHFEKGVTHKWSKEVFIIKEVFPSHPITYKLYDLNDEELLGRFYSNELQKSSF